MKRFLFIIFALQINLCLSQTFFNQNLLYDNIEREYVIYIPSSYDGLTPVPLIFSFHGGGGNIQENILINDLSELAESENFIAVYPQALPDPNDDGGNLWIHKEPTDVDDVFFIEALIDSIAENYQIDESRIYACGYSHGGGFALSLACRLNEKIAAIGVVARTTLTSIHNICNPVHPTGIITILGTDDPISLYEGLTAFGVEYWISAQEMHSFWANYNNCELAASVLDVPDIDPFDGSIVERHSWSTSDGCKYVEELKVIGGGHDWPGSFGNMDINATQEIWNFVSNYSINGNSTCNSLGININTEINKFYPNPTSNIFHIELKDLDSIECISVIDPTGKIVLNKISVHGFKTQLDISALKAGFYMISIVTPTKTFIKRLIKK
ncbi:MAG: hypothetical protein CMC83_04590 [Flavobacteriaceae bacterium]|nr:hypothetical protein [Flavobacteriaceae bacterium]